MNTPSNTNTANGYTAPVNTAATLSELMGHKNVASFRYPTCSTEDAKHQWYYSQRTSDLSYDAEASKSLIVGADTGTVLVPTSVVHEGVMRRVRAAFSDTFADKIETYDSPHQIPERIHQLRRNNKFKTIAPFPYIGTQADDYFVDPKIAMKLNAKKNLPSLTDKVPRSISGIQPNQLETTLRQAKLTRAFIKDDGSTGNHFAERFNVASEKLAGQTWDNEINRIMHLIVKARCQSLLIENYIDSDVNYSVQLNVNSSGVVELVHFSKQRTGTSGAYEGNDIDFAATIDKLPLAVQKVALEAGQSAARMGWRGVFGLDILYYSPKSSQQFEQATLIDPNFRVTAPTTAYLLRNKIIQLTGSRLGSLIDIKSDKSHTIDEKLMKLDPLIDNGDLLLSGGAVFSAREWKLYGVVLGNSWNEIAKIRKKLLRINQINSLQLPPESIYNHIDETSLLSNRTELKTAV